VIAGLRDIFFVIFSRAFFHAILLRLRAIGCGVNLPRAGQHKDNDPKHRFFHENLPYVEKIQEETIG
jgi:hypothetical protein